MKIVIPVGNSRANIIPPMRMEGITKFRLLLTYSLFREDKDLRDLISYLEFGTGAEVDVRFIQGPEKGPVECRDSLSKLLDEEGGFVPDRIFVSASTNLIVAQLRWMYPDSDLITLRHFDGGSYLYNLSKEERISKVQPIDALEYLNIHGIEIEEESLVFKGQKIPFDELIMPENGSRLSIRWRKASRKMSPTVTEIGSFVQLVAEHCGPSNFEFILGPSGSTSNWIGPDMVRTNVEWWEEE